jgi:dolichol kinase
MTFFGPIAREHERTHVNSATWFGTGIFLAALLWAPLPGVCGLIAAAVGDPIAGFAGRRWGRTRLYLGRSLEGSLAFAVTTFAVALPWGLFFHPEATRTEVVAAAAAAAIVGAIVEHLSKTIDDNLAILIAGGGAASLALALV